MQINLNMDNCWGIVRALVDLCLKLEEGKKFLLLKDPNKPLLRLYEVGLHSRFLHVRVQRISLLLSYTAIDSHCIILALKLC